MTPAGLMLRAGGLASSLAAGALIGLALAAPASADASGAADSSTPAASADRSTPSGPDSRDASGGAPSAAALPSVSAGKDRVPPAVVVSATPLVRAADAAAPRTPKSAAARDTIAAPDAAAATTASAPAPSAAAFRSASAGNERIRPAAVVSATRVVRGADVGAPLAPKAVAAQDTFAVPHTTAVSAHGRQAPASAEPVRAAAPAAPSAPALRAAVTKLRSLFTCDPRGRLITVYKGTHFVIPQSFGLFVKHVSGTGTFTADSVYDLGDADQYDWNKFTGIAFSPIQHDRNSAMVGWRYNLTTQEFEIAPFYNVDKQRILPNEQTEVISVPADATFQYTVDYSGVTISYDDKSVFKPYPPGLEPNCWTAVMVSGWFGGNRRAPRTLTYYLNLQ